MTVMATDGFPLKARLWAPEDAEDAVRVALINAGAGITSAYYNKFAQYLAESGYPTVVYDYRGIGGSRHGSLRGFVASVDEWGSKDCAAILFWLACRYPSAKRLAVGHSIGGFLTGFAANGHLIDEMVLIGAHTGYWGDYAARARPGMYLLWHVVMPILTQVFGYFPGRRLHVLEDLPKGVALQWASRHRPDFWWNLRSEDGSLDQALIGALLDRFQSIHARTLVVRFSDDPFATAAATSRILSLFMNCESSSLQIAPRDVESQKIGHFGFFRSRFRALLWPRVTDWLQS